MANGSSSPRPFVYLNSRRRLRATLGAVCISRFAVDFPFSSPGSAQFAPFSVHFRLARVEGCLLLRPRLAHGRRKMRTRRECISRRQLQGFTAAWQWITLSMSDKRGTTAREGERCAHDWGIASKSNCEPHIRRHRTLRPRRLST